MAARHCGEKPSARLKSIVNLVTINETFPCVVDLHDQVLLFLIAQ
jgi:hypothetical protein